MVQIYEQVVSDIENKDTHCNFLYWLQNSNYFTYIYSRKSILIFADRECAKLKWSHFWNIKLICPPMNMSILKMESSETADKAEIEKRPSNSAF